MDHKYIKYEKLSEELKSEIDSFHQKEGNPGDSLDTSLKKWFTLHFDQWLRKHVAKEEENKRKFYRLQVELPVSIVEKLIDSSSEDEDGQHIVGHAIDISRGGLYFTFDEPLEPSSIIKVKIDLLSDMNDPLQVEALAMVVRCDPIQKGYGVGIMFSSIYEKGRESIDLFLLQQLALYMYH